MNVDLTLKELHTAIEALSRNYRRLQDFQIEYERKYVSGMPGYVKFENDALLEEIAKIGALHERLAQGVRSHQSVER